jgi:hypothetical protein
MDKITKYGWTYITQGQEGNRTYEIIPPEKKDKPTVLYKLYSFNDYALDSLLNTYVYATHPHLFNDIFDCYEDLIEFDDEEVIRHFVKHNPSEIYSDKNIDEAIANNFQHVSTYVKRNFREQVYQGFGVLSMTSNAYNLLMWSYYTNHYGFFIEFDITKFSFKFHGPFPLNYQEKIEAMSIKECGVPLAMLIQTNLKYKGWEHEEEWRLLIESEERMYSPTFERQRALGGHDRKFKYPIEAIKTIGFGNRFFDPDELNAEKNGKVLHVTLKTNTDNKAKLLDFLIANNIHTCFTLRDGIIKISYTGMVIEKKADKHYIFDIDKYAAKYNQGAH